MAQYAYTFTSGDTVTPTKLNDARTVSNIVDADIKSDAAIAHTKLANITAGQILLGNASNVPTATAVTGDVTISNAGVTSITAGAVVNAGVSASAAIAHSKLANITAGQVLLGDASNVPTATALSGDVTVNSSGVTAIGSGVIVDADVSASAAIALSKLATGALPTGITVASANIVDGTIVDADVSATAAIADTKLATIGTAGKVSNSATTATSANTASAIVARDASGNFSAGTITAALTGNVTGNVTGNAGTATTLQTARTIAISGDVTGTATSFNGSSNITISSDITAGSIVNADVSASAAIAHSKLANITAGQVLLGNASNVPTSTALSGDVTVNSSGVTAIGSGVIVDADIDAAAAIAGSKLAAGAIGPTQLASNAVETAKILDANVTPAKLSQPLTVATYQATSSGTAFNFTGIPSWARRITITLHEVSTNGTSVVVIRAGSGSILTSGYVAGASYIGPTASGNEAYTSGFGTVYASGSEVRSGTCVLTNVGGNIWIASGVLCNTNGAAVVLAGSVVPAGTLDRVQLTTINGTDDFDGGGVNIMYEG